MLLITSRITMKQFKIYQSTGPEFYASDLDDWFKPESGNVVVGKKLYC